MYASAVSCSRARRGVGVKRKQPAVLGDEDGAVSGGDDDEGDEGAAALMIEEYACCIEGVASVWQALAQRLEEVSAEVDFSNAAGRLISSICQDQARHEEEEEEESRCGGGVSSGVVPGESGQATPAVTQLPLQAGTGARRAAAGKGGDSPRAQREATHSFHAFGKPRLRRICADMAWASADDRTPLIIQSCHGQVCNYDSPFLAELFECACGRDVRWCTRQEAERGLR